MASSKRPGARRRVNASATAEAMVASQVDELFLAAMARGSESLETGRYLVSYREGAHETARASLKSLNLKVASALDFTDQAVEPAGLSGADALFYPEIGVAVVGGPAFASQGIMAMDALTSDPTIETVEPEYFVFADANDYLSGFVAAANTIARDIGGGVAVAPDEEFEAEVLGATWGLARCKVPPSVRSGAGIKVAVLDTGFAIGHPDFLGRVFVGATFVGQPVQDLHGHGTHCIGTACGPRAPAGKIPRYGIGYATQIYSGKVLTNAGGGTGASVLGGMNWAIGRKCEVISMSLGSQSPVQAAYTNAGAAALKNGCLIVAAAGNSYGQPTGAPANSPTIMAVASLDPTLAPSNFSNRGKIEIAAPGRDVFSSWPMPKRYNTISGTSMATPHVAGCAALWASSSPTLRGKALWAKLVATAKHLPYPATQVGAGLVQAP